MANHSKHRQNHDKHHNHDEEGNQQKKRDYLLGAGRDLRSDVNLELLDHARGFATEFIRQRELALTVRATHGSSRYVWIIHNRRAAFWTIECLHRFHGQSSAKRQTEYRL